MIKKKHLDLNCKKGLVYRADHAQKYDLLRGKRSGLGVPYGGLDGVGHRYSASGLGVRWVVAIDSTRVRVPARALFLFFTSNGVIPQLSLLLLNAHATCTNFSTPSQTPN